MSTKDPYDGGPSDSRLDAAWQELVRPVPTRRGNQGDEGDVRPGRARSRAASRRSRPLPPDQSGAAREIESLRLVETFGDVELWRGWDHLLDRPVMIRALSSAGTACPRRSQQFWTGARVQARLQHPRLIAVHMLDESRNWVVTECAKHSLAQELRKGRLPATRVRRFLEQALEGLSYLHEQGEVHGQMQPDSLLVDDQGNLKIDRPLGVQPDGVFLYRPGLEKYIAPEALDESRFGDVGPAVDLYGLGMTMLELLVGDTLGNLVLSDDAQFTDVADAWQKWHVSVAERLPPIHKLAPKTPPRLAHVLDRLLAKHVDERYRSAREAYAELTHVEVTHHPTASQATLPAVVPQPTQLVEQRPARRSPRLPVIAATTYVAARTPSPEASRLAVWADKLTNEKTGNLVSVMVLLLATFTAGLMMFSERSELSDNRVVLEPGPSEPTPEPPTLTPPPAPERIVQAEEPVESTPVEPSPPPPPAEGTLTVTATPAKAAVLIDGVELPVGSTWPRRMPAGTYQVEVRQWNYFPWRGAVTIAAGQDCQVNAKLQSRPQHNVFEPPPLDGPRLPSKVTRYAVSMLDELWWDVPAARHRYPNLMAKMTIHHQDLLSSDARIVHAAALWELRIEKHDRARVRFEQAARLAPAWYSLPRKHVIRDRLLAGDWTAVRDHSELFVRALNSTSVSRLSAGTKLACLEDAGRFLGSVSGLLEGPLGQEMGLSQLRVTMPAVSRDPFDEERALALQHYHDLVRSNPSWSIADDLIEAHLHDTVVLQRDAVLRSLAVSLRDEADEAPSRPHILGNRVARFVGSL